MKEEAFRLCVYQSGSIGPMMWLG